MNESKPNGETATAVATATPASEPPREKLTKKAITADHPTWCPGCGDFAVLASFYKVLEKRNLEHEKIVTLAGIGCSSRFPYFVNGHGAHYIHGRAVPLASGISLARPDLHVFLFGGDGDGFSIGGNHLDHGARKNINMTYFIMDNFVYGLTKKQTSPTSPIGFKSKTDPTGAIDQPVNPMKKLIAGGATFIARTHAAQVPHMIQLIERAMDHQGFSVIECLSECVEFFPGRLRSGQSEEGRQLRSDPGEENGTTRPRTSCGTTSPTSSPHTNSPRFRSPAYSACFTKPIVRRRIHWRRNGLRIRAKRLATPAISKFSRKPSTE